MIVQYDLNSGHPEKAIARLQQQVDRDPQNPELLTALARIELQNHQLAAARGAAQGAVGMAPDDGQARRVYVECLVAGRETESAIGTMKLWLDRHPTDAQAVTLLGQLEESEGHGRMAMNLYWKALSLEPHEPQASNSLAGLLLVNGSNRSVALRLAQDAHGALPDWPAATDTLGWIYYWEERYLSARDLLEEAVRDDPSNAKAQYHLGMTCRRLGDKTAAALHLKKAISLAPGSDSGKAAAEALMHPG